MIKKIQKERANAVRRYLGGEDPESICASLGKTTRWLYKWVSRHTHDDSARIDKTAIIGKDVSIHAYTTIGKSTHIGNRVVIYPCVHIGDHCAIGDDTIIYPNAVIYNDTVIGKRVTIHSNTVIGSSGFGYAPDGQSYYKIPQTGIAVIEDDVDIGANTTINRSVLGETVIKKGTKIDSQVVISHNVEIVENSLIVSQVGIAGSPKIGKHVTLAGGIGVVGHIKIRISNLVAARGRARFIRVQKLI